MKKEVVNYDTYDYDYKTYWEKREYEHLAEVTLFKKYLKDMKGGCFIDVGGSYGRLLDTYVDRYKRVVILDYSLKTLQKAYKNFDDKVIPIAANVYKIPFKNNVFDAGSMIRVLHHLKNQEKYFEEISRVLSQNGILIQEIPNKAHLKRRIEKASEFDYGQFHVLPEQARTHGALEGSKGETVTFLNYHPKHIESLFERYHFDIIEKRGCSFFRSTPVKNVLGLSITLKLEDLLQKTLNNTNLTPSIIYKVRNNTGKNFDYSDSFYQMLQCPECSAELDEITDTTLTCRKCNKSYQKKKGVWDFRV